MIKVVTFIVFNFLILNTYIYANNNQYFSDGVSFYNEGKINEAIFLFEKSVVFNPKDTESYIYLGYINKDLEELDKANHYFLIALTLQPNNLELNYLVGEYFYNANNKESYSEYIYNLEVLCPDGCDYLDQIKKLDKN